MGNVKQILKKNKMLFHILSQLKKQIKDVDEYFTYKRNINKSVYKKKRIFYFGIPAHPNLGDLAQGVCIRRWLKEHYPDYTVVEIETDSVVNTHYSLMPYLKDKITPKDFIVYQSGYTTTDLGGFADEMHQTIIEAFPENRMLMMPQTIFFVKEENKIRCEKSYNTAINMLYLARDRVSYEMAQKMFPKIKTMQFPDIVTSLIGTQEYHYKREKILFCCRDDGEKYYTDEQLLALKLKCEKKLCRVDYTDTTKNISRKEVLNNAEKYILSEIDRYAHYKAIMTDRYHGTIFSLIAGTPVIVIKTTDHKVTTGTEWFKGIYDEYIYSAEDLEDAFDILKNIMNKDFNHQLNPYFKEHYYDQLPKIWREAEKNGNM